MSQVTFYDLLIVLTVQPSPAHPFLSPNKIPKKGKKILPSTLIPLCMPKNQNITQFTSQPPRREVCAV